MATASGPRCRWPVNNSARGVLSFRHPCGLAPAEPTTSHRRMPEIEEPAELRSTEFTVEQSVDAGGVLLTLSGELDLSSAPELEQAISESKPQAGRRLLLDLSGLGFMDSTGVSVLIAAKRDADANGWLISVRHPNGQVRRLLELVGLLERLEVEE